MKIKTTILALVLISIGCNPAVAVVGNESTKVATAEQADSMFQTFKKDMRCLFSRKQKCTSEQRKRLVKKGLLLAGAALLLGGGGFLLWKKNGEKAPDQSNGSGDDQGNGGSEVGKIGGIPWKIRKYGSMIEQIKRQDLASDKEWIDMLEGFLESARSFDESVAEGGLRRISNSILLAIRDLEKKQHRVRLMPDEEALLSILNQARDEIIYKGK